MEQTTGKFLIAISMGLWVLCNAFCYQCKFALKRKGYPMNLFSNHFRDFTMIDKAVSEETDLMELARLRTIQRRMKAIWIIFPIAMAAFFLGGYLTGW